MNPFFGKRFDSSPLLQDPNFQILARMPIEVVTRVLGFVPVYYLPLFLGSRDFRDTAIKIYLSNIVINDAIPMNKQGVYDGADEAVANYMNTTTFTSFARNRDYTAAPLGLGQVYLQERGFLPFLKVAMERLSQFKELRVTIEARENPVVLSRMACLDNIRSLDLTCSDVDWADFRLPERLESLTVCLFDDTFSEFHSSLSLPRTLKNLSLAGVNCTKVLYDRLPPFLETLAVGENADFSVSEFNRTSFPASLTRLHLHGTGFASSHLEGLVLPPTVHTLKIEGYNQDVVTGLALPPSVKEFILKLCSLKELHMDFSEGLETVRIADCPNFTPILDHLAFPQSLRSLTLYRCQLTNLNFVGRLPNAVQHLDLRKCTAGFLNYRTEYVPLDLPSSLHFPDSLITLQLSSNPSLFHMYDFKAVTLPLKLAHLDVSLTGIRDLNGVSFPKGIRRLYTGDNPVHLRKRHRRASSVSSVGSDY
ncbi:hypothetical protein BABINDRAFT_167779 [Babjeviella inositovora NRRL Y-12698]|uniref:F-box domain-containing protein n=1 Tax=Babjeviella inositovora NRRL Y-12698 TaxID=984486 RepID=A0A1E3QNP4_9ASCO|nr:uncharacterized protein BABINDRAFT_167779 [Babjeviella inositovora NRRL Y-12698]ODQ79258.1 hypothetical protein BABINDRAFT_167779 [Babjeviella inositovora NRRL Y-12698]